MEFNQYSWPITKAILISILDDQLSDTFVCQLVWERLGYKSSKRSPGIWLAGPSTPTEWIEEFPSSPNFIASRNASVFLTRSIPKEYKQALKKKLNFKGYSIGKLYPRRTRRAVAVNWLLAFSLMSGDELPEVGSMPPLRPSPSNPLQGHPGDPLIQ